MNCSTFSMHSRKATLLVRTQRALKKCAGCSQQVPSACQQQPNCLGVQASLVLIPLLKYVHTHLPCRPSQLTS